MKKYQLILLTLLATLLGAPAAAAQSSIDKAIAGVEKDKSSQYVVYSEKRNPATSKIYKSSKVMVVKSQTQLNRLIKAFGNDREKTVSYEMRPGRIYVAKFQKNNERREYVLVRQANGSWLLTVEIVIPDNAKKDTRSRRVSGQIECGATSFTVFI